MDRLDAHAEWNICIVGWTASPVYSSLAVAWVTSGPDTETDTHRGLWVARTTLSITIVECAYIDTVNDPFEGLWRPVDSVCVVGRLRSSNTVVGSSIVGGSVSLPEVVGLDLCSIGASELPIDFVQVI